MNLSHLARHEYEATRTLIADHDLHNAGASMPVDILGLAGRLGWRVEVVNDYQGIWATSAIVGDTKLICVSSDVSGGIQRGCVAHVLGHELLGHRQLLDLMVPSALEELYPSFCAFQDDCDAWGVAALLMIPDGFAHLSAEEIAARCHCSYQNAMRRLIGIAIDGDVTTTVGPRLVWSRPDLLAGVGT